VIYRCLTHTHTFDTFLSIFHGRPRQGHAVTIIFIIIIITTGPRTRSRSRFSRHAKGVMCGVFSHPCWSPCQIRILTLKGIYPLKFDNLTLTDIEKREQYHGQSAPLTNILFTIRQQWRSVEWSTLAGKLCTRIWYCTTNNAINVHLGRIVLSPGHLSGFDPDK